MATSRSFAYNSGSPIAGTTQVGNIAAGNESANYGNGLEWWNGPDEDLGYVICYPQTTGSRTGGSGVLNISAPTVGFWRSQYLTDESFLTTCNTLFNQGFNDTSAAKTWLNSNGYWTSYVGFVNNGLTLKLDANDSSSYPGTGNVWYDIAGGTANNITLSNSPSYTATAPSYFTFNGNTQYGLGSGSILPTTSYTKSVWVYLNGYADNNIVSGDGHFMYMGPGGSTQKIYCGHSNWPNYTVFPSTANINLNTWYYVALTFNTTDGMKLYINGALDSTYTANKGALSGTGTVNLATYNGGNLLNGRIAKVYCYNTSLTGPQVLQNFNADKSKFGL